MSKKNKPNKPKKASVKKDNTQKLHKGASVMTRDEFFVGKKGQIIHPEKASNELYRRTVIVEANSEEELALIKTHLPKNIKYALIPDDKRGRRFEKHILTRDENDKPIKLTKGRFELGNEPVTAKQATAMKNSAIANNKKNLKRLQAFRKNNKEGN